LSTSGYGVSLLTAGHHYLELLRLDRSLQACLGTPGMWRAST
jgi:hypothetical protein